MWLRSLGHCACQWLVVLWCCGLSAGQTIDCNAGACQCCICVIGRSCDPSPNQNFSDDGVTQVLPGSLEHAGHVQLLNLSYNTPVPAPNPLVLYSESFVGLVNLETLDLQSNQLRSLPDRLFEPIEHLNKLDLSQNSLPFLTPDMLSGLSNLTTLLLNDNQLTSIPPGLLNSLPALVSITLEPNPWDCTSNDTIVLYELVMSGVVSDGNQVRCASGDLVMNLEFPPVIIDSTMPEDQLAAIPASNVPFSVAASGNNLMYQWLKDGAPVVDGSQYSGASSSTLTVVAVEQDDDGLYSCIVSNGAGSVTSRSAQLISIVPPSIVQQPQSQLGLSPGDSANFTVVAVGTALTYSWIYNIAALDDGGRIAGANMPTLTISDVQESDAGDYRCLVSNSATQILSDPAVLSLIPVTPSTTIVPVIPTTSRNIPIQATPTPTPTPLPQFCLVETTVTSAGYFDWPETLPGDRVMLTCPNGPSGGAAGRMCMSAGVWGEVEVGGCGDAPQTTQLLAEISESDITAATAGPLSAMLASLPSSQILSLQEVGTVLDLAELLLGAGPADMQVLGNTLSAIDSVLESSGPSLLTPQPNSTLNTRLRMLIDTVLLNALSANQTQLVLEYSHLAVGGVYLVPTSHTTLLTVIHIHEGEDMLEVEVVEEGGGDDGADVEVMVEGGTENSTVQVTVYEDSDLFDSSECEDGAPGATGEVMTPIISVTDNANGRENITIIFHGVQVAAGDSVLCARWNGDLNCGAGGWQTDGCMLVESSGETYRCYCSNQGTFTILDIPGQKLASGDLHNVARILFYVLCGITVPLYLTFVFTILLNKHLSNLPTMQSLVNISIAQPLSFVAMAIAYERTEVHQVCYVMAVLVHYFVLVSLCALGVYPIMVGLRIFRRMWYEKEWLIAPFATICWVLPAIVVGVYGGVRYSNFPEDPQICWVEGIVFPNYFTGLSSFMVFLSLIIIVATAAMLACSDYIIETTAYLQLGSFAFNVILYFAVLLCQFFTASGATNTDHLLLVTGVFAFSCGAYFFIANTCAKSRVRSALMCREDPVLKRKTAHCSDSPETDCNSRSTSRSSIHLRMRRTPIQLNDEMNINYVDSYLGASGEASIVPLVMLNQVQQAQGKRVKGQGKRQSIDSGDVQLSSV